MPAGAVDADLDLGRERTLGNLAVDGGPGQPGPGKHGSQADDTVFSNRRVEVKHFRALSPGCFDVFSRPALLSGIGMEALPLWGPVE